MTLRKKPYTSEELFKVIMERLNQQLKVPGIIEYCRGSRNSIQLLNEEWSCTGELEFGSNEGAYVSFHIYDEEGKHDFGTLKTLNDDPGSFRILSNLQADFICEVRDFVNKHLEDFNWKGYDIRFYKNEKPGIVMTVPTSERAKQKIESIQFDFDYAIITDNRTKKSEKYHKKSA